MNAGKSACKYSLQRVVPEFSGTLLLRLSAYWILLHPWASLVAQMQKNPPAMQEGMATYSSVLVCESHGQRRLVGYSPWCYKDSDTTE